MPRHIDGGDVVKYLQQLNLPQYAAKIGGEPVEVKPNGAMLKILKAHPILYQAIEADPKKRPLLMAELRGELCAQPSAGGCRSAGWPLQWQIPPIRKIIRTDWNNDHLHRNPNAGRAKDDYDLAETKWKKQQP